MPANDEPDYVPEEYSDETKELLEEQGYTEKDVEMLEAAGLTEAQVRRVWVKGKETQVPYDYSVVAYDAVYYVNDILAENTQVLTVSSAYYGDENYTYGNERLYADNTMDTVSAYVYDGRGSVVQVIQKLAVVNSFRYTDYGSPEVEAPNTYTAYFGYNGEEYDPLTELQYLRARNYLPEAGIFTTQDTHFSAHWKTGFHRMAIAM